MLREGYEVTSAYEANHWWFRSRRRLFLSQVARAAKEIGRPNLRILDYGCGTGFNLSFLAEYGSVVGADVADLALGEFRSEAGSYPRLDLRDDLSQYYGAFDIVVALDVLEHMDDDAAGLRLMGQFLAPEGQLILTVPAYQWLWSGEDVISLHKRRYTQHSLQQCAVGGDFTPKYLSYFNLSVLPAVAAVIWGRRILNREALEHSNLQPTAPWLNASLEKLTTLEAALVGNQALRMPAGASLIARLAPASLPPACT